MGTKDKLERIYIKLGTSCNLKCKYCHVERKDIQFNPAILPILKDLNLRRITFGGGEPLLYWNVIKQIVLYLGDNVQYKVVTNGTLFTEEIVEFCNQYNFLFFISVDGIGSTRDDSKPIKWDLVKKLKFCGTAITFYRENRNILDAMASLDEIKEKYLKVEPWIFSSYPNFVHVTRESNKNASDLELVESYVQQMTVLARESFNLYKQGIITGFLHNIFKNYVLKKNFNGIRCCNDKYISILANGDICICPYTLDRVGSIFELDLLDWDKIKFEYSKEECLHCKLFDICGNFCCKNVTDHECLVMKRMYEVVVHLMNEFKINYDELYNVLI